jgi:SAM-dependent methyltransferase
MQRVTSILAAELTASGYRPPAAGRIVDVGGGSGTLLAQLLLAAGAGTGVLFDRAEALAEAPGVLAGAGVAGRVELVPGDFMQEVPAGGDLYVLCQVLHNWHDELARVIVGNCHRASRPGSSLLVIEYVLPDGPEPSLAHLMDLIMLTLVGGRERTRAGHAALMAGAGYTLVRDTPLDSVLPWHALEFRRD